MSLLLLFTGSGGGGTFTLTPLPAFRILHANDVQVRQQIVAALEAIAENIDTNFGAMKNYVDDATEAWVAAVSDETTALTVGTAKITFRAPYAFTLTDVRASVNTAPTGATIQVDINEGGVSILSTTISIDINEKTSTTAATPPVISDTAIADDAEITIDIDQIGSIIAGAGLKVTFIGHKP